MVEFNANGLYAFGGLMKNLSVASFNFGKEWIWWLVIKVIEKSKELKEWVKAKFNDYFLKKDLSKDEL